jgi:hypothetical protein
MANINIVYIYIYTRCHVHAMSRACGMLMHCRGFVEKIIKKLYEKKLLQSIMFLRKKL